MFIYMRLCLLDVFGAKIQVPDLWDAQNVGNSVVVQRPEGGHAFPPPSTKELRSKLAYNTPQPSGRAPRLEVGIPRPRCVLTSPSRRDNIHH